MMRHRTDIAVALPLLFALLLAACDEGLVPDPVDAEIAGFEGTLRVVSDWPPADSVRDLRVIAFREYPPKDILSEVVGGTAVFSEPLAYDSSTQAYRVQNAQLTGSFRYIVAAQQYGENLFQDWRVVGVFTVVNDVTQPGAIDLGSGRFVRDVDIRVDFRNLPPQPF